MSSSLKFKKAALFTDIHWGKKNNSELHNNDCLRYIKWFCDNVSKDKAIDHIVFLGDWFDHRNSINIATLNYSYKAMNILNSMNMPVWFLVGNHDLYTKNTRDIHSLPYASEFSNFNLIEKPHKVNNILFLPFIFEDEYQTYLKDINDSKIIYGHLELKGFVLTGSSVVKEHGPDHTLFFAPKKIFTGHFHKRQTKDNVTYIGNTFPFDFSDANDTERGLATYDYDKDKIEFIDWKDAPTYFRCNLSDLIKNHKSILKKDMTVKALNDSDVDEEQAVALKTMFIEKYQLRELSFEEQAESIDIDENINLDGMELHSTRDIVEELITRVDSKKINNDKLIKIYKGLR